MGLGDVQVMMPSEHKQREPTPGTNEPGKDGGRKVHRTRETPLEYGGILTHEIRRVESAPPIEVPPCLGRKRYVSHFIESQPD